MYQLVSLLGIGDDITIAMIHTESNTIIDTHLHTNYSNPFELYPLYPSEVVLRTAVSHRLSGVIKTDHNTWRGTEAWMELASRSNIATSPAIEVSTCVEGKRCPHVIAVMPEWRSSLSNIPTFEKPGITLRRMREMGAFIIIPHPVPRLHGVLRAFSNLSFTYDEVEQFCSEGLVDGIEVATPLSTFAKPLIDLVNRYKLLPVGASDAHVLEQIGTVKTKIPGIFPTVYDALLYGKAHPELVSIESRMSLKALAAMFPSVMSRLLIKFFGQTPELQPVIEVD